MITRVGMRVIPRWRAPTACTPIPARHGTTASCISYEVFALNVETLSPEDAFTGQDVSQAMEDHILASPSHMGTYSMNPAVNG